MLKTRQIDCNGSPSRRKIAAGNAQLSNWDNWAIKAGDVLVSDITTLDWEPGENCFGHSHQRGG
jgi:hypothetical protein